jgi:hypothetical protein
MCGVNVDIENSKTAAKCPSVISTRKSDLFNVIKDVCS